MTRVCIGIDNGHYGHKLWDHCGKFSTTLTRAKLGENQMVSMIGDSKSSNLTVNTDGLSFTCGKIRRYDEVNPRTFPTSQLARVLLHYSIAMHEDGKYSKTDNLHVCTGIPLGRYFKAGKAIADSELVAEVEANLSKPATIIMPNGEEITRSLNVVVKPQTFVAWYAYILEEIREPGSDFAKPKVRRREERFNEPVAMIDIGGGTTEICIIEDAKMDMLSSGSEYVGSNDIRTNLEILICDKFKTDSISSFLIDSAMATKKIAFDGSEFDVSELYKEAHSAASAKITSYILNKLGTNRQRELNAVRLIGGGVHEFRTAIESTVKRSKIVENPQHENAKGMYLMCRYLLK